MSQVTPYCADGEPAIHDASPRYTSPLASLTATNATTSPLLRLPSELRNHIWQLLYSDLIVNIDGPLKGDFGTKERPRMLYQICGPNNGNVCVHFEPGINASTHPNWVYTDTQTTGEWIHCSIARPFAHPKICRQFWAETTATLFETSTWVFHHPLHFQLFIRSHQSCIPRIRRIVIRGPRTHGLGRFSREWHSALVPREMWNLQSLEGIRILIETAFDDREDREMYYKQTELLSPFKWKKMRLNLMLNTLRQHKLKEGLTSVEVNTDKGSNYDREYLEPWCEKVRERMLQYEPVKMLWPELSGKGLGYRKPGSGVFGRATKNDAGES